MSSTPTLISADASLVTIINVFEVAEDQQSRLLELMEKATEDVMRHQPGFVSANLHRSLDGTRVANYGQWKSMEDYQRMLANPEAQVHMKAAIGLVKSVAPATYTVSSVHR